MTLAPSAEKHDAPGRTSARLVPLKAKIGAAALGLAVFGFICYGLGTNHGSGAHVLTGQAYVGSDQATVTVGGWAYGFDVSPNGMNWYDASGGLHEGGIPPCLQHPGTEAWIRFGYADAPGLDGQPSQRVVTWEQCVSAPRR